MNAQHSKQDVCRKPDSMGARRSPAFGKADTSAWSPLFPALITETETQSRISQNLPDVMVPALGFRNGGGCRRVQHVYLASQTNNSFSYCNERWEESAPRTNSSRGYGRMRSGRQRDIGWDEQKGKCTARNKPPPLPVCPQYLDGDPDDRGYGGKEPKRQRGEDWEGQGTRRKTPIPLSICPQYLDDDAVDSDYGGKEPERQRGPPGWDGLDGQGTIRNTPIPLPICPQYFDENPDDRGYGEKEPKRQRGEDWEGQDGQCAKRKTSIPQSICPQYVDDDTDDRCYEGRSTSRPRDDEVWDEQNGKSPSKNKPVPPSLYPQDVDDYPNNRGYGRKKPWRPGGPSGWDGQDEQGTRRKTPILLSVCTQYFDDKRDDRSYERKCTSRPQDEVWKEQKCTSRPRDEVWEEQKCTSRPRDEVWEEQKFTSRPRDEVWKEQKCTTRPRDEVWKEQKGKCPGRSKPLPSSPYPQVLDDFTNDRSYERKCTLRPRDVIWEEQKGKCPGRNKTLTTSPYPQDLDGYPNDRCTSPHPRSYRDDHRDENSYRRTYSRSDNMACPGSRRSSRPYLSEDSCASCCLSPRGSIGERRSKEEDDFNRRLRAQGRRRDEDIPCRNHRKGYAECLPPSQGPDDSCHACCSRENESGQRQLTSQDDLCYNRIPTGRRSDPCTITRKCHVDGICPELAGSARCFSGSQYASASGDGRDSRSRESFASSSSCYKPGCSKSQGKSKCSPCCKGGCKEFIKRRIRGTPYRVQRVHPRGFRRFYT